MKYTILVTALLLTGCGPEYFVRSPDNGLGLMQWGSSVMYQNRYYEPGNSAPSVGQLQVYDGGNAVFW